jgi:hypothetical protein
MRASTATSASRWPITRASASPRLQSRDVSFDAADKEGEKIVIDAAYVREHIGDLAKNADLSKFIL